MLLAHSNFAHIYSDYIKNTKRGKKPHRLYRGKKRISALKNKQENAN